MFLLIFAVLLVPIVMDQAEVDRETVPMVGRVAAGIVVVTIVRGFFARVLRTPVVLVSEGKVEAPHLRAWFASLSSGK